MQLSQHSDGSSVKFVLEGQFTFDDQMAFRKSMASLPELPAQSVVLDLSKLEYIDSSAMALLLLFKEKAAQCHKQVMLVEPTGYVKKVFDLAHFSDLFRSC